MSQRRENEHRQEDNPVYWPGPKELIPQYIYFYYLGTGLQRHQQVRVYFIDEKSPTVLTQTRVEQLVMEADSKKISPVALAVADLTWRFPGYLVFVVRHKTATLDSVVFKYKALFGGGGNHTFRDGADIKGSAMEGLSGLWCINHRLKKGGAHLEATDHEKFEIIFRGLETRTHNETGTNTGP